MRNLYFLSLITLLFAGCSDFKTGEEGFLYKIHTDKPGETIKEHDLAVISLIEKTEDDSVIYSSSEADNRPVIRFRTAPLFKGDFNTALGLLSEGDSATLKIRLDSLIASNLTPANMEGKYMVYHIKVIKVMHRTDESDSLFTAKFEQLRRDLANQERPREQGKIDRFLKESNLKPKATSSGLLYTIETLGKGPVPRAGDSVFANYTGMYLSGKPYKTTHAGVAAKASIGLDPVLPVSAGKGEVFDGLDEVLQMFPKGSKVKVVFPSKIAYGDHFHQGIEPYTPLLWDIEISDVRPLKSTAR